MTLKAVYECIKALSDDQIVSMPCSAQRSSRRYADGVLRCGAHGMPSTRNDEIHADLIAFFHQGKQAAT
jgi:hypothetical protein